MPGADVSDGAVARWEANDGLELLGYRVGGVGWVAVPGVAAFRFDGGADVVAVADGAGAAEIHDAWVRSVLPLVVQAQATQVLHASALEGAAGAVALCGASTAGKSTLAAALMQRGRSVLADDALAFDVRGGDVTAWTLPFRMRLWPESAAALGLPGVAAAGQGGSELPLEAVVLLEPHDEDTAPELVPVAAAEAFGALMPQAYCFSLEEGKEQLVEAYLELARLVPVWRLAYPQRLDRLDEVADALQRVLDG